MKYIFMLLLFIGSLFAGANDFLEPKDAFKVKITQEQNSIKIDAKIDESIYIYDDKLKVFINDKDITKKVFHKKPENYHEFVVHFGDFSIDVPISLIEDTIGDGEYTVKLKYQGCSKKGLCYAPMKSEFKGIIELEDEEDENGGFLEPKDAFKVNIFEQKESIKIDAQIDKTIYLYDDKLKVFINDKEVTKKVFNKKPVNYHEFIVHFGDFSIDVPKSLIKDTIKEGSYSVKLKYQGCSKKGLCYAPMSQEYSGSIGSPTTSSNTSDTPKDEASGIADILNGGNIFLILITFFGFGLLLSLTPCIFPMIPILSSIIVQHSNANDGKMSASKGFILSLVYVLAMSMAYTGAGILAGLFGANIQAMLQNPTVLVVFAGVFVALAFSLFGYYSLELPQSFTNKINSITGSKDNKGMTSVAIMGFLSALIVGPCVAPPLAGALVYIGQTGDAVLGGLALFVMSLGLGAPLLLVGAGAGKYMPKPGGWMETVSKVFGVVMLALAVYMLDRIIPAQATFILYALLSLGTAIYLFKSSKTIGKVIAMIFIILGGYLGYSATNVQEAHIKFEYVKTVAQLDKIIKETNKPIMLDFYAQWCVSCKELEHITYADPKVQEFLSHYRLLKADVTDNTDDDKALQKKFNVFGPPALIFWDKNGKEEKSKKIIGFKNAKDFMDIVNK